MLRIEIWSCFLNVFLYLCIGDLLKDDGASCQNDHALRQVVSDIVENLHVRHVEVIHGGESKRSKFILQNLHENGITTSLFNVDSSDPLIPSHHTGLYWPNQRVILGVFDKETVTASLCKLKQKSILSSKTKMVLITNDGLQGTIKDVVTEGDKLLLVSEEPRKRSKSYTETLTIQVLKVLSEVLDFSIVFPDPLADSHGTKGSAGVWGGAVGQLARKERDIAGVQLSWTPQRNEVIDFTEFYQLAGLTFGSRAPRQISQSGALFRLFRFEVWITYFLCSLVAGGVAAVTWIFYEVKLNPTDGSTSRFSILRLSLEATLKISVWQGVQKLPKKTAPKIVFLSWTIVCLILLNVYCGNILAFLSIKESEIPLDTVSQVLHRNVSAYYYPGTSTESFLRETPSTVVRELWKINRNNNKEIRTLHQYLELVTYGGIFFASNINLQMIFQSFGNQSGGFCPFYLAREILKEDFICFGLQKNSPLLEPMNYGIQSLKKGGIIQFWQKKIMDKNIIKQGLCDPRHSGVQTQTNDLVPLLLNDVFVAFEILLFGYAVSVTVFCISCLIEGYRKYVFKILRRLN
ncbi:glutamate receptor-like [Tachypleus tridentatus]|uniref:glutamate receptor-like n=1 Tax=Tachypleus tridentatus TaxID=6853 RepID=UPI003FD31EC6